MAVDGYLNFNTKIDTKGFNSGTKQISSAVTGMKSMFGKLGAAVSSAFAVKGIIDFGKQAIETASDIQEVQNVVDVSFGSMKSKMEEFADSAIENYGISKLTAKQTGSTYMAMAKGMQIADDAASDMAVTLTGLSADMASFYNKEQSATATALNSVFTGETETLKTYGIVMTEANLQQFAYTQGINKKISAMSQAEKVQLRYNYVLSQTALAQGDFARTSDGWANQVRILNEQWKEFSGTVGTILINTLIPAIQTLNEAMSWLNVVAQNVLSTLSAIFDWEVDINNAISTGVENQEAFTEAINATIDAKNRELASFDKINKLSDNSSSSGSGSGIGNSVTNSSVTTIDVDTSGTENKLSELQQKISDFISSLTITFSDVFIDWEDLTGEQIAEKIITALGALVGGVVGFSLGGVSGAITGALTGVALSLAISSLTFDHDGTLGAEEILSMITMALLGLVGGVIGFSVGGATGAAVGISIGAGVGFAINEISFDTDGELTGEEIAKYVIMALGAVAGGIVGFAIGGGPTGAAVGIALGAALSFGIVDISFDSDSELSTDEIVGLIVTALLGIAGGVIGFVVGGPGGAVIGASLGLGLSMLINQVDYEELGEKIGTFFTDLWDDVTQLCEDIKQFFSDTWDSIEQVGEDIGTFFSDLWSDVTQTVEDCWNSVVEFFSPAVEWFSELFTSVWQTISDIFDNIIGIAEGCWESIQLVWGIVSDWFDKNIITPISDFFSDLWGGVKDVAVEAWTGIKTEFSKIGDWIYQNIVSPVSDFFSDLWGGFSEKAEDAKEGVTEAFKKIPEWFRDKFSDAWQKVKDVFSKGGKVFDGIKDGILNGLKSVINGLIGGINRVIEMPFNGINTALKKVRDISIAGVQPFANKISLINVPQIPKLATGTVVPANYGEFLAVLGDNKRETEVVSPLSTIKKAVAEVLASNGDGDINITVTLDGDVVYKNVVKKNKQNTKRTGVNALAY